MPLTIFVADDDPVVRHILTSVLKAGGYSVTDFSSGTALLAAFDTLADYPDVLFLDLQLGDMTGAEVLPQLRKKAGEKTKVIVLSAHSKEDTEALFPGLEADQHLSKPFTPAQVGEVLALL